MGRKREKEIREGRRRYGKEGEVEMAMKEEDESVENEEKREGVKE